MKTKEIKVWVNPINVESKNNRHIDIYTDIEKYRREWVGDPIMAKLIIEIPEKKIEITESQLRSALQVADRRLAKGDGHYDENVVEWLFGDKK